TLVAWFADGERTHSQNSAIAIHWARQTAAQASGLAFSARERGEDDPIGVAAEALSQGVEPRVIHVAKVRSGFAVTTPEYFRLQDGVFEYTKILTPEDGGGIRVKLEMPFAGFFGARNVVEHDFTLAGFFLCLFLPCWV